jgi:hypothetical protein
MLKKVVVLFAVAGLILFAVAIPGADQTTSTKRLTKRYQRRDSLLALRLKSAVPGLQRRPAIHEAFPQAGRSQQAGPPRRINPVDNPFTGSEFMPGPEFPGGVQEDPALVFDGTNYLVVWDSAANHNGVQWQIYGRRVTAGGSRLGSYDFVISDVGKTGNKWFPRAAFDGTKHLVVWQDNSYFGNDDIYGALVSIAGVPSSPFPICTQANDQESPAIAFDGVDHYLVVWSDWRSGEQIRGALVNTSGSVDVSDIPIHTSTDHRAEYPRVAFDGDHYLVVWDEYAGSTGIHGTLVSNSGSVLNPAGIDISDGDYDLGADVAFDGTNYLVVWYDYSAEDIYGALVRKNGYSDGPFPIRESESYLDVPAVCFDGSDYVVAWLVDYWGIDGCRVDLDGSVVDDEYFTISSQGDWSPALASGPVEGTVMAAYQSATYEIGDDDYEGKDRIWARAGSVPMSGGDVGTASIMRPVASFLLFDGENYSRPIPPVARLVNNGAEARSFNAEFTITDTDDDTVCTNIKTVLGLRPGQTRSVEFDRDSFDLETEGPGLYTAKCTTMLADDDDESNDSMTAIFQGCDFINFSDIDDGGLTPTPDTCWTCDVPASPPWTALPPMDDSAWGERLNGQQNNNENSYLTSPWYEALQDYPSIAFQHCFSTESLMDGGNLQYKVGEGSWSAATPSTGFPYNGTVAALGGAGWSGWLTGHSGWKQSVFTFDDVTEDDTFRVRFHYASGASIPSRGWLIDELAGINCDLYLGKFGAAGFIDTLNVCPNPVCGKGEIRYTLRKPGNVTVKLYDASGRMARQLPTSGCRKGQNNATLDATRLTRGVYFVKVEGASNFKTTKVIIE